MTDPYRDDLLLPLLPFARGFDRELLISALGHSDGLNGAEALQRLWESEKGHCKTTALQSLVLRAGAAAVPALVEGLHSRSAAVQETAAWLLAHHGDEGAMAPMLAWLKRRLKRAARTRTWSPYELSNVINLGARLGKHREVAEVIAQHWSRVERDEQAWLLRTWPGLFDEHGLPKTDLHDVPVPSALQRGVYNDDHGDLTDVDGDELFWGRDTVDEAVLRVQRRAGRANEHQK